MRATAPVVFLLTISCASSTKPPPTSPVEAKVAPKAPSEPTVSAGRQIAAGYEHTCVIHRSGRVVCWGDNSFGQLGAGHTRHVVGPLIAQGVEDAVEVSAGTRSTCARTKAGEVECWGELGKAPEGGATTIGKLKDVVELAVVDDFACARLSGGRVACWGDDEKFTDIVNPKYGQGEIGHEAVALDVTGITRLSMGRTEPCALDGKGRVVCMPQKHGQPPFAPVGGAVRVTSMASSYNGTCVLDDQGGLHCVRDGKLRKERGLPPLRAPIAIGEFWECGSVGSDLACSMGGPAEHDEWNTTPRPPVDSSAVTRIPGLGDAVELAGGRRHLCALRSGGAVVCVGANDHGQLGSDDGRFAALSAPVPGMNDVTAIDGSGDFTCALHRTGKVSCWGTGAGWDLGALNDVRAIAAGPRHACAARHDGTVACWGDNHAGRLGGKPVPLSSGSGAWVEKVRGITDATAVAVGEHMSCAVTKRGVVCWGWSGLMAGARPIRADRKYGDDPVEVDMRKLAPSCGAIDFVATCGRLAEPQLVPGTAGATVVVAVGHSACALVGDAAACWTSDSVAEDRTDGVWRPAAFRAPTKALRTSEDRICGIDGQDEIRCTSMDVSRGAIPSTLFAREAERKVVDVASSFLPPTSSHQHECIVTTSGIVECSGPGDRGQLGDGRLRFSRDEHAVVPDIRDAIDVSPGRTHTCALSKDGTVRCWGYPREQLGLPPSSGTSAPGAIVPIDVEAAIASSRKPAPSPSK